MTIDIDGQEYKMRGFQFKDVFTLSNILAKIDLDLSAFKFETAEMNEKEILEHREDLGKQLFSQLVPKLGTCEKEITDWIADLTRMKPQQVSTLPITDVAKVFRAFMAQPGLDSFFEQVGSVGQ